MAAAPRAVHARQVEVEDDEVGSRGVGVLALPAQVGQGRLAVAHHRDDVGDLGLGERLQGHLHGACRERVFRMFLDVLAPDRVRRRGDDLGEPVRLEVEQRHADLLPVLPHGGAGRATAGPLRADRPEGTGSGGSR
jgi:hypothetical protein